MSAISQNIIELLKELPSAVKLVAVSKFKPSEDIMAAYDAGQRVFAESRPQELKLKAETLPNDIQWHFIGHLQTNKIKMVVPYASLIHSVDSLKLLMEIENYCLKNNMETDILLEAFIATEETKQGFSEEELLGLIPALESLKCVRVKGLMAMASFTEDEAQIRKEFATFNTVFDRMKQTNSPALSDFTIKSFGMTNDYHIAIEMGSNMVRIGTKIFGARGVQL